ncbi:MAG TPA: amylo-alpha-1,6-glucosidase, partial [Candidatus Limnocylindria bacterium]|nr:amylo-alpha-1,6-glucosidase [Candidatus Limnocylindria bacterium]
ARVRQEFPDTVFHLEGLGGSWEATNDLLGEGGMQWAYSELFQNFGGQGVQWYLDHSFATSLTAGTLIHYSETHDNARLAAQPHGRNWSLHRNLLSALTGVSGGFGFTNGVEWLATEQVNVHGSRGLAWGSGVNLLPELGRVNRLLASHPCFFDGARLTRLSPDASPVYLLRRDSADGKDSVLVLVNTDAEQSKTFRLDTRLWSEFCAAGRDLLETGSPDRVDTGTATAAWVEIGLRPGAVHCLAPQGLPRGVAGENYRRLRAVADWAVAAAHLGSVRAAPGDWKSLSAEVDHDPAGFLARTLGAADGYQPVITWSPEDRRRVTLVPPGHWVLVRDRGPFRARLTGAGDFTENVEAVAVQDGFVACLRPRHLRLSTDTRLELERYGADERQLAGTLRFLAPQPAAATAGPQPAPHLVLLTNGRGAMARLHVDLGRITSKYDCLLGANLNAAIPVDRHIFAKRIRVWVNADGFVSPLNFDNLIDFEAGPPAHWRFVANAGDGRSVEIHLVADLLPDRNTIALQFSRLNRTSVDACLGRPLPQEAKVALIVRVDIEDRNFHWETKRNGGTEYHFSANCRQISTPPPAGGQPSFNGFEFTPANDRQLRVWVDAGHYHHQAEWSLNLPHPVEAGRGQEGAGDAYSPGWFEVPLARDAIATLVACAETSPPGPDGTGLFVAVRAAIQQRALERAALPLNDLFGRALVLGTQAYVVKRDDTKSVIAGYPWFLDWGRDSLICARGLIAAGMFDEVRDLLITFGRFEKDGTLPNSINGADASNRDTTDAPLWFGVVAEELAEALVSQAASEPGTQTSPAGPLAYSPALFTTPVDGAGRPLLDVLRSIACGYLKGTPNGIRVDAASGLVWSPSHFTWMDTNHPAGTPREGYPVEIQVLWVRLLRLLARIGAEPWEGRGESWSDLARRTERSLHDYFWLEDCGWYADVLLAARDMPARTSPPSNALRSNCLLLVALGVDRHPKFAERARRMVEAAARQLVIPGALRSLAPLPIIPPLAIFGNDGGLLNDPNHPYWPRYEGDEDTRRKPAYHNGTAWTWTFPAFCEALVKAYPGDAQARAAARAYLGSIDRLLAEGCLGHLPEILDGDAPHTPRGCDAQAWGITESLRVWRWLGPEPAAKQV